MRKIWTGPFQFTPYRPWSEERKYGRRAAIAKAQGRELNEPKRVYCGPYLLALPPPSWWRAYIPSVPPFRIRYTRLDNGMQYSQGEFKDMRVACSRLWDLRIDDEHMAEVVDAKGGWIMRIGSPQSVAAGQTEKGPTAS